MSAPSNWFQQGLNHIWIPYAQMKTMPQPAPIESTGQTALIMPDGQRLIDGVGSWWTCVHGYNNSTLIKAASDQLNLMPHVMLGGIAHEQAYRLATRLADLTPGDLSRVFLSESGSVAVEVAMKIAVQYWSNAKGEQRSKFVAFNGGYHGDTFATMSVCDPAEGMHQYFAGALADQHIVDLPKDDAAIATLDQVLATDKTIAAVMVEPLIQGAGGMQMHSAQCLKIMRELCDRHGVLLIFDEIFTGFGRTGHMFAAERAGVTPDIMTLGKALTGGITPLAATIASQRVYDAFHCDDASKALMHGPTFTGHAVGCAVANASIDLFTSQPRLDQVHAIEQAMTQQLTPLAKDERVKEVRICGAVAAVELASDFDIDDARQWFIDQGVFIRPLGRVVYLSPSYTISADDLRQLCTAIGHFITTQ